MRSVFEIGRGSGVTASDSLCGRIGAARVARVGGIQEPAMPFRAVVEARIARDDDVPYRGSNAGSASASSCTSAVSTGRLPMDHPEPSHGATAGRINAAREPVKTVHNANACRMGEASLEAIGNRAGEVTNTKPRRSTDRGHEFRCIGYAHRRTCRSSSTASAGEYRDTPRRSASPGAH